MLQRLNEVMAWRGCVASALAALALGTVSCFNHLLIYLQKKDPSTKKHVVRYMTHTLTAHTQRCSTQESRMYSNMNKSVEPVHTNMNERVGGAFLSF